MFSEEISSYLLVLNGVYLFLTLVSTSAFVKHFFNYFLKKIYII